MAFGFDNEDALSGAQQFSNARVKKLDSGEFVVIDLKPLELSRPDYVLKRSIEKQAKAQLVEAGRKVAQFGAKWDEAPW